ncbi:hypothetical protein JTB14_007795 [Gonioctena quinquepunctata]|nr:hypothetical protein JTB14_007795 [Gonioctena quinquepunctata]
MVRKYLKGTSKNKPKFGSNTDLTLKEYVDSDWAGDVSDRKSSAGFILLVGNKPILYKKQSSVALSSTEADYIQEVVWSGRLVEDFRIPCENTTLLYEDNQGCLKLANNKKSSCRTKYIDVRHHYLRDLVDSNIIQFVCCEHSHITTDAFTQRNHMEN